jgi:hypothetical protein
MLEDLNSSGARISEVKRRKLFVWHHFWGTGSVRKEANKALISSMPEAGLILIEVAECFFLMGQPF